MIYLISYFLILLLISFFSNFLYIIYVSRYHFLYCTKYSLIFNSFLICNTKKKIFVLHSFYFYLDLFLKYIIDIGLLFIYCNQDLFLLFLCISSTAIKIDDIYINLISEVKMYSYLLRLFEVFLHVENIVYNFVFFFKSLKWILFSV